MLDAEVVHGHGFAPGEVAVLFKDEETVHVAVDSVDAENVAVNFYGGMLVLRVTDGVPHTDDGWTLRKGAP